MNLQKRIFRLNMMMLGLSLCAMLGISIHVVNSIYRNQDIWQSTSQKTAKVQASLEAFTGADFDHLADELAISDAQLYVESNGWIVFSNFQDDARNLLYIAISPTTHTSYLEDRVIISKKIADAGQIYYVYALLEQTDSLYESQAFQLFLIQLLIIGGLGILLVIALNLLFTRRILKAILRPLQELHQGVQRIQKGDYSLSIDYQGDREFEELTQGFNQMQRSLIAAHQKNKTYEQKRTQMIANISHDLRTPLTSIKGYAKGILDGVANTTNKRNHYLSIIYQKSLIMEKLLEKLFLFSQLETDQMPFDLVVIDLATVFHHYLEEKKIELQDDDIIFKLETEDKLLVKIDTTQFRRILDNLLENAQKYARIQPLVIEIRGKKTPTDIQWTFKDNGQGVSDSELSSLFTEFYRVDETRQQTEGHGLGLSIVQNIIHRLGGRVQLENTDGLCFLFTLPRKDLK